MEVRYRAATEPLSGRSLSLLCSPVYGLPSFWRSMFYSVTDLGCLSFMDFLCSLLSNSIYQFS